VRPLYGHLGGHRPDLRPPTGHLGDTHPPLGRPYRGAWLGTGTAQTARKAVRRQPDGAHPQLTKGRILKASNGGQQPSHRGGPWFHLGAQHEAGRRDKKKLGPPVALETYNQISRPYYQGGLPGPGSRWCQKN